VSREFRFASSQVGRVLFATLFAHDTLARPWLAAMEIAMTTKNVLTVIGLLLGLQGIGIFVGGEAISTQAFAALNPDATGIQIGAMLHEAMGVMCLMVALILFFARDLEPAAGGKVLMGASIGIALTTAHGFYNMFTTVVAPPLPLLVMMSVLALVGLVTALKTQGGNAEGSAENA